MDDSLLRLAQDVYRKFREYLEDGQIPDPCARALQSITFGRRESGKLGPRHFVPVQVEILGKVKNCAAPVTLQEMKAASLAVGIVDYGQLDFNVHSRKIFRS